MGLRATSFAASAALLGLLVVTALTMTIVQRQIAEVFVAPQPVTVVTPPPPTPAQPQPRIEEQPQRAVEGEPVLPLPPPETPTQTVISAPVLTYPSPTITNPEWLRRPSDLDRYYPERARRRGMEGRAVLDCGVSTQGALSCLVVSETPANWGFGEAALRISRDYQMVPARRNGVAVEARYRMVVPFELQ